MIARLQKFYGGDVGGWLKIPIGLLKALGDHVPMLEAEQLLGHRDVISAGTGVMPQGEQRNWLRGLRERTGVRPKRATRQSLAALPIEVVEE